MLNECGPAVAARTNAGKLLGNGGVREGEQRNSCRGGCARIRSMTEASIALSKHSLGLYLLFAWVPPLALPHR